MIPSTSLFPHEGKQTHLKVFHMCLIQIPTTSQNTLGFLPPKLMLYFYQPASCPQLPTWDPAGQNTAAFR